MTADKNSKIVKYFLKLKLLHVLFIYYLFKRLNKEINNANLNLI